jgi:3-methyl-2-oxobutanoate hydroxymethyltransferase
MENATGAIQKRAAGRVTMETLREMRAAGRPIAMLTCYDFATAQALQSAGVPMLLVGDSAANTMLGLSTTRDIPPEFLVTITAAVRRAAPKVFLLADMPYRSSGDVATAVRLAQRFVLETGADAVKVEVVGADLPLVAALVEAQVPVCAHLGLLPQRVMTPDGYRAQGRTKAEAAVIVRDAVAFAAAGAQLILLEAVPDLLTREVIAKTGVPVLGCGAGHSAHGHVIVLHDMLGYSAKPPRFAEVFGDAAGALKAAAEKYVAAVGDRSYPAEKHEYRMKSE